MQNRREFLFGALGLAAGAAVHAAPSRAAEVVTESFVSNDNALVRVPDGRQLSYADVGDPAATRVIIYHHGLPGCRLESCVYHEALMARPGVRMLAVDRPGIGRSSPDPRASILSWPAD